MEKFSRFRVVQVDSNMRDTSLYFNKESLRNLSKVATYFEVYYMKGIETKIIHDFIYANRLSNLTSIPNESILRKINIMAEMNYDEDFTQGGFNPNRVEINHDENRKMYKFIIACKLCTVYYSSLTRYYEPKEADIEMGKIYYKLAEYYDVTNLLDKVIVKVNDDKAVKNEEPELWNRRKEYCLFASIIGAYDSHPYSRDLCNLLESNMIYKLASFDSFQYKQTHESFAIIRIVKDALLKLNQIKLPLDVKSKMLVHMQKVVEDEYLDEAYKYLNMQSVLEYETCNRPNAKCEAIVNANKDKFPFKGVVYHGFNDVGGGGCFRTPEQILSSYTDGFISCSKDLKVARNFATRSVFDPDSRDDYSQFGGVIEILIDDSIECVDIEAMLESENKANKKLYNSLYTRYINEKEVLVKLPVLTYNILRPKEVAERLGEIEKKNLIHKKPSDKMFDSKTLKKIDGEEVTDKCI